MIIIISINHDIKANDNKAVKLDRQIERKVNINDKDNAELMQLRETSSMMNEEVLLSLLPLSLLLSSLSLYYYHRY